MPKTTVRPGHVIRDVLSRQLPVLNIVQVVSRGVTVYSEDVATAASVQDLHRTYKLMIRRAKETSVVRIAQRPMGRDSFGKYIYFAKRLALIERFEERPADGLPAFPRAPLLNINGEYDPDDIVDIDDRVVVESRRLLYSLTAAGRAASSEWDDLGKAYRGLIG